MPSLKIDLTHTMPTALAAVLYESGKPLVIEEVEVAEPQAGEVMVRMKAAASVIALPFRDRMTSPGRSPAS